jgi:tetratricopeptide (TPR) repeat protein
MDGFIVAGIVRTGARPDKRGGWRRARRGRPKHEVFGYIAAMGMPSDSPPRRAGPAMLRAPLFALFVGIAVTPVAAPVAAMASASPALQRDAAVQAAELALGGGDCRGAAERYAALTEARRDPRIARRAVEVAVSCLHLPAAWRSARHWERIDPENVEALRAAGLVALELYRLDDARRIFASLLSKPDVEADRALAELLPLVSEGDEAHAAWQTFDVVVDRAAINDATRLALADLAIAADHFGAARSLAESVVERDAGNAAALRLLALLRAAADDASGALEVARRAVEADPVGQRFTVIEVLIALGRNEEAHRELERLLEDETAREDADRRLALLALSTGDLEEARRRFGERLQRGAGSAEAFFYLGMLAERRGEKELALQSYMRLVEAGGGLLPRVRAASLLIDAGRSDEALKLFDDVPPSGRDDPLDIAIARSNALLTAGDVRGSLAAVDAGLARHPQHPQLLYHRAMLLVRSDRLREAIGAFEALLRQRPDDPTVLNALGYTLGDNRRQLPRATRLVERALELSPDNAAIMDSVGWLRFRRGDAQGALPLLERAYRISRDAEIAAHWAEVLWTTGDRAGARRVWAQALVRHPDSEPLLESFRRLTGQILGPAAPLDDAKP